MASIGKRPLKKYWYVYFRDSEGKQRQKSTGIEVAPYHGMQNNTGPQPKT